MITNPKIRDWIYIAQMALGLVLLIVVAVGVIDQDTSIKVEMAVGSIVLMLTGQLARSNISSKTEKITTHDVAAMIGNALGQVQAAAAPVASQVQSEFQSRAERVVQARRDLEARAGGDR